MGREKETDGCGIVLYASVIWSEKRRRPGLERPAGLRVYDDESIRRSMGAERPAGGDIAVAQFPKYSIAALAYSERLRIRYLRDGLPMLKERAIVRRNARTG